MVTVPKWPPPPTRTIKINIDAMLKSGLYFTGVIVRDHRGDIIAIQTFKEFIEDLEVIKLRTIYRGLYLAAKRGWKYL